MQLFDNLINENKNLLPYGGTVNYYGRLLSHKEAIDYYDSLLHTIAWKNDVAFIFGKRIETKRKVA